MQKYKKRQKAGGSKNKCGGGVYTVLNMKQQYVIQW